MCCRIYDRRAWWNHRGISLFDTVQCSILQISVSLMWLKLNPAPPPPRSIFGPFLTHINVPHIAPIYSSDVCLKWRFCAPSYNPRCLALCRWKVWLLATLKSSDKFTTALPGKSRLIRRPEKLCLIGSLLFLATLQLSTGPICCIFFFFYYCNCLRTRYAPIFFFLNPIQRGFILTSQHSLSKVWWRNLSVAVFPWQLFAKLKQYF